MLCTPLSNLHPNSLYLTGKTRVFSSLCTHVDPGSITYSLHLTLHVKSHHKCQLLIEMYIAHVLVPSWHLEFIFCQLVVYTCCHGVYFIYMLSLYVYCIPKLSLYIYCINTHMHISHSADILLYTYVSYICICVVYVFYYVCVAFVCVLYMYSFKYVVVSYVLIMYPQTASQQADSIYYM